MTSKFGQMSDSDGVQLERNINQLALHQLMARVYEVSYGLVWLMNELHPDAGAWVSVCPLLEHPHPSAKYMLNRSMWQVTESGCLRAIVVLLIFVLFGYLGLG